MFPLHYHEFYYIIIIIIIITAATTTAEKLSMLSCLETSMQKKLHRKASNKSF